MDQQEFLDTLIEKMEIPCNLERISEETFKYVCKHHKHCAYKDQQKGGVNYCTFIENIKALADSVTQSSYI